MKEAAPIDSVDPRDYYVVNELYDSYTTLKRQAEKCQVVYNDDVKKTLKAFKRVLKFYGKEIE